MKFAQFEENEQSLIDLTPLIDVVFLLLIFFMISTTFTKETQLHINLPQAKKEYQQDTQENIEIHIGSTGQYAIKTPENTKALALTNNNRETLLSVLTPLQKYKKNVLIIRADKKSSHGSVIKVLDVLQDLGFANMSFAAEQITQ